METVTVKAIPKIDCPVSAGGRALAFHHSFPDSIPGFSMVDGYGSKVGEDGFCFRVSATYQGFFHRHRPQISTKTKHTAVHKHKHARQLGRKRTFKEV